MSLPLELEDYIPEVEDFYKKMHSGRKLQWHHHMSNGTVSFIDFFHCFSMRKSTNKIYKLRHCHLDSVRQLCWKI